MTGQLAHDLNSARAHQWSDAVLAAQVFAHAPFELGGVIVRCGAGPVRDAWIAELRKALPTDMPWRRMPASIGEDRLYGGIALAETLKAGRPVIQRGLLAEAHGGIVIIPMAERLSGSVSAVIANAIDRQEVVIARDGVTVTSQARIAVIAFDESQDEDEQIPESLRERLAFHIDLRDLTWRDTEVAAPLFPVETGTTQIAQENMFVALVGVAAAFGIDTLRAPLHALRAARACASLKGRSNPSEEDVSIAARWVLGPRARRTPPENHDPEPSETRNNDTPQDSQADSNAEITPMQVEDIVIEAVRAAIPVDILEKLGNGKIQRGSSSRGGGGGERKDPVRGRPAGSRAGALRGGARLDLIATLRAAAPWQTLRRRQATAGQMAPVVSVRAEDFRLKKFKRPREATIVFCVDASGSAAFQRLGETKGAIELLLSQAYAARTYVALIAFRGSVAQIVLPPTRSLARANALLTALPGGGGTPLAAGLDTAHQVADCERRKGRDPLIVVMTDARANIPRDGEASRARATEHAHEAASMIRSAGLASVLVDTAVRPQEQAVNLAAALAAEYIALPVLNAHTVSNAVARKAGFRQ